MFDPGMMKGILRDEKPHELHVPSDLSPPVGAALAEDGTVACVTCTQRVPLGRADVVGQGYRCTPCSQRAGSDDVHVHLDARERREARAWGTRAIVVGVAAIVISLAIGFAGVIGWRKPSIFAGGGLGAIYIGWRRRRDLRG